MGTWERSAGITLVRRSGIPRYRQVVEAIGEAIRRGTYRPGDRLPTIRALARTLDLNPNTVARAYRTLRADRVVVTGPGRGTFVGQDSPRPLHPTQREEELHRLFSRAFLEGLSRGYSLDELAGASALLAVAWGAGSPKIERPPTCAPVQTAGTEIRFAGSHDLTLDLLGTWLRRGRPRRELRCLAVGSLGGLIALTRREAHLAGTHILDAETGEYNLPAIKGVLPGIPVVVLTLAHRQQGLLLLKGNPKGIRNLRDLARGDIRFINRQRGSGTRILLDQHLRRMGIAPGRIRGYETEATTHLEVASAVASGQADAGMGIFAAARALGLEFLPLLRERYDLVLPAEEYQGAHLRPLLRTICSPRFRRFVEQLGGYEVGDMGRVVARLSG